MLADKVRLAAIGGIVAVLLLAVISWVTVLSGRMARAGELQAEAAQVELANLTLVKRERDIQALAAQAPELAAQAQELFARMPQTAELPIVLQQISDAAVAAGIKPADIQLLNAAIPQSLSAQGPAGQSAQAAAAASAVGVQLATMGLDITVAGSQENLLDFIDRLQSLDRALLLNSTAIAVNPAEARKDIRTLTAHGTLFVLETTLPDLVANAEKVIAEAQAQAGAQGGSAPAPAPTAPAATAQ